MERSTMVGETITMCLYCTVVKEFVAGKKCVWSMFDRECSLYWVSFLCGVWSHLVISYEVVVLQTRSERMVDPKQNGVFVTIAIPYPTIGTWPGKANSTKNLYFLTSSNKVSLQSRNTKIAVVLLQKGSPTSTDVIAVERSANLTSKCDINSKMVFVLSHNEHLMGTWALLNRQRISEN